jgi:GTP:adenosylcobinamide-phosphate guanylyltransferase
VLLAGDRGHARAVRGRSKAYLEVSGKPMVVHVLEALIHTDGVTEVFVVGNPVALQEVLTRFGCLDLAASAACPVHVVPQYASLVENIWQCFLRTLPAGPPDPDHAILVVPSDIPLVVPEELLDFVRKAQATGADYVAGLSPDFAMQPFQASDDSPGIEMASFNVREGRFRQSNLHYVKPLRMEKRRYIQDMYEHRYQKQIGNMIALAVRVLGAEWRRSWLIGLYVLMHTAAVLDRRGYRRWADRVRAWVPIRAVESGAGQLLGTRFTTVTTELGGAAMDVDNAEDLEAADKMLPQWKAEQIRRARAATLPSVE